MVEGYIKLGQLLVEGYIKLGQLSSSITKKKNKQTAVNLIGKKFPDKIHKTWTTVIIDHQQQKPQTAVNLIGKIFPGKF